MIKVINIPKQVNNDITGFNWLAAVAASSIVLIKQRIDFDFANCTFFAGHLCAALGGILQGLLERKNDVHLINMSNNLKGFLSSNRFLTYFKGLALPDFKNSTIPFASFRVEDELAVKNYVEAQLLDKLGMPAMSEKLKKEIVKSIFEIYVNALTHGNCELVFSCGQTYLRRNPPEIYFTFVDLGKTIKNNVAEYLNSPVSGIESIIWATTGSNSTKTQNHSGGLGLKLVREFIELNNGVMQIVSADGIWELNRGRYFKKSMAINFPGTIVNLVFNLKDKNQYCLTEEISPFNIF